MVSSVMDVMCEEQGLGVDNGEASIIQRNEISWCNLALFCLLMEVGLDEETLHNLCVSDFQEDRKALLLRTRRSAVTLRISDKTIDVIKNYLACRSLTSSLLDTDPLFDEFTLNDVSKFGLASFMDDLKQKPGISDLKTLYRKGGLFSDYLKYGSDPLILSHLIGVRLEDVYRYVCWIN